MIIFGTRGVKSTMEEGTFHCPQCNVDKNYKHKKVTNFFTLYFIPLIPLGKVGEYVECQTCRGTFVPRVLELTGPTDFLSEYEKAIKHSLVLIMLADGEIDPKELTHVLLVINKFTKHPVSMDALKAYIDEVKNQPQDISTYLKSVAPQLNEHGKEILIKCALSVSASDGNVDRVELDLIVEMARALQMSGSHLKGILHELTSPEKSLVSQN